MEKTRSWSLCRRSAPLRPKKLVGAHRPHVDRLRFRPAEQVRIKGEGGLPFARVQLVPAGQPRSARRRPLGRLLAQSPEQNKTGALWVGNNREPADAGMSSAGLWMVPLACLTRPAVIIVFPSPSTLFVLQLLGTIRCPEKPQAAQ
jgi:hypothetical protein